ncbi:Carbamoyl-phosphate synthase large chain like [Actinidia chinensis var. chinensis]|uniref:Carbamoyl-phosphate synthase large chain like n=1 Tax=Actinidia chinensis var. chinensis TaxID=1590841 RepID=A0A2R6PZP8_ACTCC|nr:Carbamoyl-phosphate synthase large chain like [Actinidia chinensis var. chinensis]
MLSISNPGTLFVIYPLIFSLLSFHFADELSGNRVFVRVDNNSGDGDNADGPFAVFADDYNCVDFRKRIRAPPLPDHIRREMLELGFPDEGYNCLREIKRSIRDGNR